MKLLNVEVAVVPQAKIVDYLLSETHSSGKGKAGFFTRFGFSREHWQELANALLNHASENDVNNTELSAFGIRYVIDGELETPAGRRPMVRSVWFTDTSQDIPRFVSAYPLKPKKDT